MAQTKTGFITLTDISDGVAGAQGASVLVVYADTANAATNTQSLTIGTNDFVAYFEYTGTTPTLPIRTGITFAQFTGADGQFERTVYQNGAEQPDFPVGGDEDTAPTGWTFEPTESETQRFKSVATFEDGDTTVGQETSLITFSGTTAEVDIVDPVAEVTQIGISGGNSSNAIPGPIAEVNQITFTGTSANTVGVAGFSRTTDTDTFNFEEIAFGSGGNNGGWVGVGFGGDIFVSTTGAGGTWEENTTTKPEPSANLNDVSYDPNGLDDAGTTVVGRWVAVATKRNNSTQVWTATDPAGDWVHAGGGLNGTGLDTIDDESMNAVIHDGNRWIVVGSSGTILTAVDPTAAAGTTGGWVIQTRDGVTVRSLYGIEYVENFDGTTPLYVIVGDDLSGAKQLFYTETASSSWTGASDWTVNDTHGESFDFVNVKFANDIWIIAADLAGSFSNIIITADPRSMVSSEWTTVSSGIGSELRDAAYDGTNWYVSSSSSASTYALGTYADPTDPTSTLSWTTDTTGSFANRARAVEFADNQLVFGTTAGILVLGTGGVLPGSVLTIDGDDRNFSAPVTIDLGGPFSGLALRNDAITKFNSNSGITGLTAGIGSTDAIMTITAVDAGVRGNTLSSIANPTGNATTADSVLTAGTDENGILNQELNFTLGGTAGDLFSSFTDVTPATGVNAGIRDVAFGNNIYVAVGEPNGTGNGGVILTSTNGTSWTVNPNNSPVASKILTGVTYDGTTWWAVGDTQTVIRTTDPTGVWIQDTGTGVSSNPQDVIFGNGILIIVGNEIRTTTDGGTTWHSETEPSGTGFLFSIAFDSAANRFVAVGSSETIITTTDNTAGSMSWSFQTGGIGGGTQLRGVGVDDNGVWIVGGNTGLMSRAVNPTLNHDDANVNDRWTPVTSGTSQRINEISFGDGLFIYVTQAGEMRSSPDGETNNWTALTSGISTDIYASSFVNGGFVFGALGASGQRLFIPGGAVTTLTIDGDDAQFNMGAGPVPITFTAGIDGAAMVSEAVTSLEANTTGLTITGFGDRIQIDSPAGATATTTFSISGGTATATLPVRQVGAGAAVVLSSYVFTADSNNHSPETISDDFPANITAAQALVIIRDLFTGMTPTIGGYTVSTISGTTFSVTSTVAQAESPLSFIITDGTGGTLVESSPVTTDGANGFTDGTADSWATTINRVEYTGAFTTQSDGTAQATQQAALLNTAVVLDEVFVATSSGAVLTITARDNGNQFNTITSVTRGTPKTIGGVGTASDANRTPPVVTTDGRVIPDWSQPVQDGFRGGLGLRGAGRHDRSFTVLTAVAPDVLSTVFNEAARCAVAGGFPFNTDGTTVTCLAADDVNSTTTVALANPVEGDVVVLTVTESDGGVATRAAIHDGTGIANDDWEAFAVQIDGNLLVDGTIVANKLAANTITAGEIAAGAITIAAVTTNLGVKTLNPGDIGAGESNTESDGSTVRTDSRLVIEGTKISIYEGSTLRVVLGDLT